MVHSTNGNILLRTLQAAWQSLVILKDDLKLFPIEYVLNRI